MKEGGLIFNKLEKNIIWKALLKIERAVIIIAGACTALIVFFACALRLFNINFAGFEEILILVVFWLYMMGCAYGSYEKSQITADILAVMMREGRVKSILTVIRYILTFVLGAIFMYWGWQLLLWTVQMDTRTPVWRIPMVIGEGSIFVGLLLSSLYNFVYMADECILFVRKWKTGIFEPDSDGKGDMSL